MYEPEQVKGPCNQQSFIDNRSHGWLMFLQSMASLSPHRFPSSLDSLLDFGAFVHVKVPLLQVDVRWRAEYRVWKPPRPRCATSTLTHRLTIRPSGPTLWRNLWPLWTPGMSLWGSWGWCLLQSPPLAQSRVSKCHYQTPLMQGPRLIRWKSTSRRPSPALREAGVQRGKRGVI